MEGEGDNQAPILDKLKKRNMERKKKLKTLKVESHPYVKKLKKDI